MKKLIGLLAILALAGCEKKPTVITNADYEQSKQQQAAESNKLDVIGTMSQQNSLKAGQRAADKIKAVSAEQNKDLKEVEGE
jgi:uncharacterized lipoprotein YajG